MFTGVFKQPALQAMPWYSSLGNHGAWGLIPFVFEFWASFFPHIFKTPPRRHADYNTNASAQLSPYLQTKDARWNAWRSNYQARCFSFFFLSSVLFLSISLSPSSVRSRFLTRCAASLVPQVFTPAGYSSSLLSIFTVETIPWMATYKSQPGINFLGLTPPIFVGDVPVAGNGTAPPATDTQLTCTYSTTSYCSDAAAFTAWQNAQLKQLEGWLINDKSTWKIVRAAETVALFGSAAHTPPNRSGHRPRVHRV